MMANIQLNESTFFYNRFGYENLNYHRYTFKKIKCKNYTNYQTKKTL